MEAAGTTASARACATAVALEDCRAKSGMRCKQEGECPVHLHGTYVQQRCGHRSPDNNSLERVERHSASACSRLQAPLHEAALPLRGGQRVRPSVQYRSPYLVGEDGPVRHRAARGRRRRARVRGKRVGDRRAVESRAVLRNSHGVGTAGAARGRGGRSALGSRKYKGCGFFELRPFIRGKKDGRHTAAQQISPANVLHARMQRGAGGWHRTGSASRTAAAQQSCARF